MLLRNPNPRTVKACATKSITDDYTNQRLFMKGVWYHTYAKGPAPCGAMINTIVGVIIWNITGEAGHWQLECMLNF